MRHSIASPSTKKRWVSPPLMTKKRLTLFLSRSESRWGGAFPVRRSEVPQHDVFLDRVLAGGHADLGPVTLASSKATV